MNQMTHEERRTTNPLAPKPSERVCPKCGKTLMTHYVWLMDAESYGCEDHGTVLRCTRSGMFEFKDGSVYDRDGNVITEARNEWNS